MGWGCWGGWGVGRVGGQCPRPVRFGIRPFRLGIGRTMVVCEGGELGWWGRVVLMWGVGVGCFEFDERGSTYSIRHLLVNLEKTRFS